MCGRCALSSAAVCAVPAAPRLADGKGGGATARRRIIAQCAHWPGIWPGLRRRFRRLAGAPGIDRHGDGKTGAQQPGQRSARRQRNPHRHALHDLGEIAGRVVRRQQAELGAAGRREALDPALQRLIRIGVDRDLGKLSRPHSRQLRLLEIRRDVDVRQWHQRQQLGPGLDVLADLAGAIAGHSRNRRADHRIVEIVLAPATDWRGPAAAWPLPRAAATAAPRAGSARRRMRRGSWPAPPRPCGRRLRPVSKRCRLAKSLVIRLLYRL